MCNLAIAIETIPYYLCLGFRHESIVVFLLYGEPETEVEILVIDRKYIKVTT